jgi:hypothetical protein
MGIVDPIAPLIDTPPARAAASQSVLQYERVAWQALVQQTGQPCDALITARKAYKSDIMAQR